MVRGKAKKPQKGVNKRVEKFNEKKSDTGLHRVMVYLDTQTLKALTNLSGDYGYKAPRTPRKYENRSEVLTNIIGYCVRRAAGFKKNKLPHSSLEFDVAQSIYRLVQIVKYRKSKKNETSIQIAEFMNLHRFPNLEMPTKPKTRPWTDEDVEYALNSEKIQKLLNPSHQVRTS